MRLDIRQKLVLFTCAIILLVGGAISTYSIYELRHRSLAGFEDESMEIANILSGTIAEASYFLDVRSIRRHLDNARTHSEMSYVYVMDAEGVVLSDGTEENPLRDQKLPGPFNREILSSKSLLSKIEDRYLKIGGPVLMADGSLLGFIYTGFYLGDLYEMIFEATWANVRITLFCLGVGIVLAFIFARNFARPILSMIETAKEIGKGKFDVRSGINRGDEFGQLAECINKMALNLSNTTVSKSYVDNIIKSMADALIVIDHRGKIKSANQASVIMLGHKENEIVGKDIDEFFCADPTSDNLFKGLMQKGHIKGVKRVLKSKKGPEIPVLFSASVFRDREDRFQGIVCVMKDTSLLKEAEDKMIEAKEQAEETNRLKSDFLSTMSHELRTPLTVVLGNVALLTDEDDMPDPEEVAEISRDVEGSARHLLILINDLLDISKIEAGKMNLYRETVSVPLIIKDALSTISRLAEEKGIVLESDIEEMELSIDPIRFKQVLLNLLSNALKFTSEGKIMIKASKKEDIVLFQIQDTGCGIPEKGLPHIFDKFRQVDGSTTRSANGTGLGLSITKQLLEMHGGGISVESVEGEGTSFEFFIPFLDV